MVEIKLGDKVVSKVSGFTGTVTAKEEGFMFSETAYLVESTDLVDGEVVEDWFDESVLDPIECSS
jgi:hypothetical protein